jgi:TPR repeat protein
MRGRYDRQAFGVRGERRKVTTVMQKLVCSMTSAATWLALLLCAPPLAAAQTPQTAGEQFYQRYLAARRVGDKQAAIDNLQKSAELGDSDAQAQLGGEYTGGDIDLAGAVEVDYAKAYQLTKLALDQGNPRAMLIMGNLYMKGMGVEKDYAQALKWYLEASQRGDTKAPRLIGIIYENGFGTKVDYKKAADYYRQATDLDDVTGQCQLGSLYERGLGVEKDYERAAELYGKAADRGNRVASGAMAAMGNLYETRTDGKRNLQNAIGWYKKAAAAGNPVIKADLERLESSRPRPIAAGRNLCLSPFPP